MLHDYIKIISQITPVPSQGSEDTKAQLSSRIDFMDSIIPGAENITDLVTILIEYALDIVGVIAVAMIVYGGFLYITSGGDENKAKQGTQIITYAAIGIIVVLAAVVIVRTIRGAVGAA
jgi:hypothetical protein